LPNQREFCKIPVLNVAQVLPLKKIRRHWIHQTWMLREKGTTASDSFGTEPASHCPDTLSYSLHLTFVLAFFLHISNMCQCFDEFEHRCFGRCTDGCAKCMKEGRYCVMPGFLQGGKRCFHVEKQHQVVVVNSRTNIHIHAYFQAYKHNSHR